MSRLATYRFASTLSISEFQVSRVESERELEEVYSTYAHHRHPAREMFDAIHFETFVFANKNLTDDEQAAFEQAMMFAMRDFQSRFESILRNKRMARKEVTSKTTKEVS